MKTLFGERKSVKTLAFILALALILPLLPVMSVVGAPPSTITMTFEGVTEDGDDNVGFCDENENLFAYELAASTYQGKETVIEGGWGKFATAKAKADTEKSTVTISEIKFTQKTPSFDFRAFGLNWDDGTFEIYMQDGSNDEKILTKDSSGLYKIKLTDLKDGKVTIRAKQTKTITFPSVSEQGSRYTVLDKQSNGINLAGPVKTTATSGYEFYIEVTERSQTPVVSMRLDDGTLKKSLPATPEEDNPNIYKVEITAKDLKGNCTITVELREALTVGYQPATGSDSSSFTITGSKDVDLYSVPYGKTNFEFTVEAAAGYELVGITYNGKSIVDTSKGAQNTSAKMACKIAGLITQNATVFVQTRAVKPTVTLKAAENGDDDHYTVSGIVAGDENKIPVSYGGSFTFSVTPKAGYDSLKVSYKMGNSGSDTEITPNGNTYTINGITKDVTITIKPGDITKFGATLISDEHVSKVTDDDDAYKWEETKTIAYNDSKTFKVKPNNGYKVTAIKVYAGNNLVIENTDSTSITVSNITSDLRIEVTTEPITVTVSVSNGGNLNGTYVFKYGESKFDGNWINWESNQFKSDNADDLVKLIADSYKKEATRFGFTSPKWTVSGSIENPNADVSFALTATWTPDLSTLFVLKTSVEYSKTLNRLSFISRLEVNELADDEAKRQYSGSVEQGTVKVISYGVFYGQYSASLTSDPSLVSSVRSVIESKKVNTQKEGVEVTTDLWGNSNNGKIYFYSTIATQPIDFQVSSTGVTGNTITEYFDEKGSSFDRSGITWMEIKVDGNTAVIVGPATTYSVT